MTDAGLAVIAVARQNGSWTTLDSVETLTPPLELRKALAATKVASANWEQYSASCRKQFLYWLAGAKRPETRAARIAQIVACAKTGLTFTEYYSTAAARRGGDAKRTTRKAERRSESRRSR
jgi:uncharacterized protein YdeI (YjbR/CyaY-like superfamily)